MWDAIIAVLGFIGIYGILHYLFFHDKGGGVG